MMRYTDGAEQVISLVTETNEIVTFRGSGGAFRQTWPTSRAAPGTLNYLSGTYIYRPAGAAEQATFRETDGRLVSVRNATTGRETLIAYDMSGLPQTVTDSWSGASWNLTTDTANRRVSSIAVSDRPDLLWTYSYDSNGNLVTAFAPGNVVWRTYDYSANRMTSSRDVLGNLIESHTYDTNGYGISSTGPGDEIASIEYNLPGSNAEERITRLTYNNGAIAEYTLRAAGGAWRPVDVSGGCASCGAGNATFVRDSEGRPVLEQAADGYITRTTYEAGRVQSQEGALKPAGCNPQTDPQHCRLGPDALAIASLEATSATVTTSYEFADTLWSNRVTATTSPSLRAPGQLRRATYEYHPVTGEIVSTAVQGWTGQIATEHSRVTRTVLYGDVPPCGQAPCPPYDPYAPAFSPGGAFQSAWLSLPQPAYVPRSTDGPRSDVQDLTAFVYYPVHTSVPALLRGRLAAVKSAAGHITRYEDYDVFGNATRAVDLNGVVTETTFDVLGRTLTTTIKGITGCDTTVDPLCSADLTTTSTYSPSSGPLQHQESPGGGVTAYEYDARGRVHTISRGPSANDLRERVETTYDPLTGKKSLERTLAYEAGTWVEKTRKAFAYDAQSRLQSLTHADGAAVHYTYDPQDRVATVQDENHAAPNTFYKYDSAGRVASVTQALAEAPNGVIGTHYEYDRAGNLVTVTDPNGNVTGYVYDDFGQMLRQESAVTGVITYNYDEAGNLIEVVDANESTSARSFDALGRVLSAASCRTGLTTETVTWTYDDPTSGQFGIGRLATMTDPSGTTVYRYDRRGLLREEDGTITHQAYAYDSDGNRTKLGMAEYEFDYAGRAIKVSAYGTTLVDSVEYRPFGPLAKLTFGNGAVKTMEYDARYRPSRNSLTLGSTVIADYVYQHDDVGNITQIHDAVDAAYDRNFAYDELNRLVTANTGTALWGNGSYAYDAMGNMTALSLGTSRSLAFSYAGSTPKLASVSGAPVIYDDAGNESAVISARNLVAFEADVAHYVYDGRGVRVQEALGPAETSTPFSRTSSYSPDLHLLRYDYSSPLQTESTNIVWFNDMPLGQLSSADYPELTEIGDLSMFRYTFTDHLGTPILQMIRNDVVWRAEYEPFGRIYELRTGSADDQRLRLPGQEATTTSNGDEKYYNIFRWYRPSWGRYTQADPVGLLGTLRVRQYPGTLPAPSTFRTGLEGLQRFVWSLSGEYFNSAPSLPASLYAYADSAPTSLIDSLGLEPLLCQVFRKKAQPTPSPLGSLPGNVCQFTGYCGGSNSGQTYKFTDPDPFTYRFLPPCKECPIACIFTWETSNGSLTAGPVCFGKVPVDNKGGFLPGGGGFGGKGGSGGW